MISIKTPSSTTDGTFTLTWASSFGPDRSAQLNRAQAIIDSECIRYMDPLTPMRTGAMIKSVTLGTVIGSGELVYNCVYARRQYYNNQGGSPAHPQAKGYWFETMKASYKSAILKAAGGALK